MANHLIYSALHLRMLAEALAAANGIDVLDPEPLADRSPTTAWTWLYEVALQELREVVVPGWPAMHSPIVVPKVWRGW